MEGEDEGDYLEQEKKKDPVERQEKLIDRVERMMEKAAAGIGAPVTGYGPVRSPVPRSLTISIRRISNGYVLAKIPEGTYGHPGEPGSIFEEIFFETPADLAQASAQLIGGFTAAFDQGCPPGPEGVKGPPGVGFDVPEGT